jgi:hypothetical protein
MSDLGYKISFYQLGSTKIVELLHCKEDQFEYDLKDKFSSLSNLNTIFAFRKVTECSSYLYKATAHICEMEKKMSDLSALWRNVHIQQQIGRRLAVRPEWMLFFQTHRARSSD